MDMNFISKAIRGQQEDIAAYAEDLKEARQRIAALETLLEEGISLFLDFAALAEHYGGELSISALAAYKRLMDWQARAALEPGAQAPAEEA